MIELNWLAVLTIGWFAGVASVVIVLGILLVRGMILTAAGAAAKSFNEERREARKAKETNE